MKYIIHVHVYLHDVVFVVLLWRIYYLLDYVAVVAKNVQM